jgi:DNA-binding CsgD family transcriptional regulator
MSRTTWTPELRARLAELGRTMTMKEAAAELGLSRKTVKSAVQVFKIRTFGERRRRDEGWSLADDDFLYSSYGKQTARAIATKLGRTVVQVYARAKWLGVRRAERPPPYTEAEFEEIRRLNGLGHSDQDIAARLKRDRHELTRHRRRLGLPCNMRSGLVCRKIAGTTRAQWAGSALALANARRDAFPREYALRYGLPEDLPVRCTQIVLALLKHGTLTLAGIKSALGIKPNKSNSFLCNATRTTYTGELRRRGLVSRLCRREGGRRLPDVYMLTGEALRLLEEAHARGDGGGGAGGPAAGGQAGGLPVQAAAGGPDGRGPGVGGPGGPGGDGP